MVGYIYGIKNIKTQENYIGRHLNKDEEWRKYMGSGRLIKDAIQKYGKENFDKICLEKCFSIKELMEREEYWLNRYKSIGKAEYNISLSGGLSSVGNYWPYLEDETAKEISEKLSNSLKNSEAYKKSMALMRESKMLENEAKRIALMKKHKNEVINHYRNKKSMKHIKDLVDIPQYLIRRILVDNKEVTYDSNGHITRPKSSKSNMKISKSLIKYNIESGKTKYDYKLLNKKNTRLEIVKLYKEGLSMRSIGKIYNVRGPRIKKVLIEEDIIK